MADIVQNIALSGQNEVVEAFGEIAAAGVEAFAKVAEAAEKAESPFAKLAETLAGVAAAGAAIGGLTFKWADESAKTVHQMEILADQTGESVENISALEGAITSLGGSGEGLSTSFRRMGQAITQEWQKVKEEISNASDKVIDDNLRVDRAEEAVDRARLARQKAFGGRVDPYQEQQLKRREATTALEHAEQAEHEAEKKRTNDRLSSYEVVTKAVGNILKGQKTLAEAGKEANLTTDNIFKGLIGNTEGAEEALKNFNGSLLSIQGEGPKVLEVFKNIANFVKNSGNAAENSAVMMRLMGRTMGSDMIPVFKQGSQGIEDFMTKMEHLGLTMGEVEEHRTNAFHQAFNRLSSVLDITKTKLGLMFAQPWAENMDNFTKYVSKNHEKILAWGEDIAGKITPYIKGFGDSMLGLSRAIVGDDTHADAGVEKWQKTFETIGKALRTLKEDASSFVKPFKDTFNKLFDQDASTLQIGAGMLLGFRMLGGKLGQAALAGFAAEWTWENLKEQFSGKKAAPAGAAAPSDGKQSLLEELSPISTAHAEEAPKGPEDQVPLPRPRPAMPPEKPAGFFSEENRRLLREHELMGGPAVRFAPGVTGIEAVEQSPFNAAFSKLQSGKKLSEDDARQLYKRGIVVPPSRVGKEETPPTSPKTEQATPPGEEHPEHPARAEAPPDSGGGFPGGLYGALGAGYLGLQALLHPFKTLKFGVKTVAALIKPREFLSGVMKRLRLPITEGGLGLGGGAAEAGGAAGGAVAGETGVAATAGALPEIGVTIPGAAAAGGLTAAGALSGASAFGIFSTIVGAAKGYADRQRGQYPEAASKEDEITSTLGRNSRGIVRLLRKRSPDAENEEIRKALEENEKNLSTSTTTGTMDKFRLPSREDRGKRSELEDDATKSLKDMADATDKVNEAQKPQAGAITSVTEALKGFVTPANAAEAGLQKTGTSADAASSGMKNAGEAATQAAGGLGDVPGPTKNVASAMDELAGAIKRLIAILQSIQPVQAAAQAKPKGEEEGGGRPPPKQGLSINPQTGQPQGPGVVHAPSGPGPGAGQPQPQPGGGPPVAPTTPPSTTRPPWVPDLDKPRPLPKGSTRAPQPLQQGTPPSGPEPPPPKAPEATPPPPPGTGPGQGPMTGGEPLWGGGAETGTMSPDEMNKRWPGMAPPSDEEMEAWRRQGGTGLPTADELKQMRGPQSPPSGPNMPLPPTLGPKQKSPLSPPEGGGPKATRALSPDEIDAWRKGGGQGPPTPDWLDKFRKGQSPPVPPSSMVPSPPPMPPQQGGGGGGVLPPGGGSGGAPPPEPGPVPPPVLPPVPLPEPGSGGGPGGAGPKPDLPWWLPLEMPHGEPPSAKPPVVPMPRPRPPEATPLNIDTTPAGRKKEDEPQYAEGGLVGYQDGGDVAGDSVDTSVCKDDPTNPICQQVAGPGVPPKVVTPPQTPPGTSTEPPTKLEKKIDFPPASGPIGEPFKDLSKSPGLITSDPDLAARARAQHFGERACELHPGDPELEQMRAAFQQFHELKASAAFHTSQEEESYEKALIAKWHKTMVCAGMAAPYFRGEAGGYQHGGEVGGHGSGTSDSNLAWVSKGEYIVRADGSNLHEAIDHFTKHFATGGIVGAFADSVRGYASGGRVVASGVSSKNDLSYHQLDVRTDKGTFRAGVTADTMEALRTSALASKLSRTGERPAWWS